MNRIKIIGIAIFLFSTVLLFAIFFWPDNTTSDQKDDIATLPTDVSPGTQVPSQKTTFKKNDFLYNGETIKDPGNTNNYILAGGLGYCLPDGTCPSGFDTDTFSVSYSENTDFFTLTVLSEPVGQTRIQAEQFLMSRLNLNEKEMCQIQYSFSMPYWVNEFYAGQELGFSFCPGSVSLE